MTVDAKDSTAPGARDALAQAWAALQAGDGETAIASYRQLAQQEPNEARWPIEVSLLLNACGRPSEARAELARARARWSDDYLQRAAAKALPFEAPAVSDAGIHAYLPDGIDEVHLTRPLVADDPERDVIVAEQPGADTVAIVFTGSRDGALGTPLNVFDWHLAALGVSAIYLKDFSRLLHLTGVRSLGDVKATSDGLQDLARRLGARRLCTIGASTGGPAALYYGVELGAARIVSFSGPTNLDQPRAECSRFRIFKRRLTEAAFAEPLDAREFLLSRHSSIPIELVYGADMAQDRGYALHLEGVPGVTLHPQPGLDSHKIMPQLAKSGQLRALLTEFLA